MTNVSDVLKQFQKYLNNEESSIKKLINSRKTWSRIGSRDSFDELEFNSTEEKEEFLKEWISENPYNNI